MFSSSEKSSLFLILQGRPESALRQIEEDTKSEAKLKGFESDDFIDFSNKQIKTILESVCIFIQRKETERCIPFLNKLIEWKDKNVFNVSESYQVEERCLYLLACTKIIDKEYLDAIDILIKIETKEINRDLLKKVRICRAFCLLETGKIDQCIVILQALVNDKTYELIAKELLARALLKNGKDDECKEVLKESLTKKFPIQRKKGNEVTSSSVLKNPMNKPTVNKKDLADLILQVMKIH